MSTQRAYMSFGGGVQSTALAMLVINKDERLLSAMKGVLPELFLFSDTGDERLITYKHVWEMAGRFADAGYRFDVCHRGVLSSHIIEKARSGAGGGNSPPFFVMTKSGKGGPVRRGCTSFYKVQLLDRAARKYWGVKKGQLKDPVQQWYGISFDEIQRIRNTDEQWRTYQWILIEMRWRRSDCLLYLDSIGIEATRSSCVYCPFHGSREWLEVRNTPEDWKRVLEMDAALEKGFRDHGKVVGLRNRPYLTSALKPIEDVDFGGNQGSLFDWECAGVCNT